MFPFSKLLPLLNEAELPINDELLTLINQNQDLDEVINICTILIKADKSLLDAHCFKSILNISFDSIRYFRKTLELLNNIQLINKDNFRELFNHNFFSLSQALKVFAKSNLLDANLFKRLIESKLSLYEIFKDAEFLQDHQLLNPETLEFVFSAKISSSLMQIISILVPSINLNNQLLNQLTTYETVKQEELRKLIKIFSEKKLLNDQRVKQLLNLSSDYYEILYNLILHLDKHNQFNQETIDALFLKLGNKLSKPDEDHFDVEQQSDANLSWIHYISATDQFQLYVNKDPNIAPLAGGRAKIFQGNQSLTDDNDSKYLVKTLNEENSEEHTKKEARKETKYARFLGRESYFFYNDKHWHVISKWQSGQALDKVLETDLRALTSKNRLESLLPLLKDLSKLHDQFRVHGDIKSQNCIFDQQSMQLKLIDFGSTRKVKPRNYQIPWTPHYLDKYINRFFQPTNHYSFCDDLYALGIVIASMFPELYLVKLGKYDTEVKLCKHSFSLSCEEMAVFYLVSSMMDTNRNARCTALMARTYVESVVNDFDKISESYLEEILMSTLGKPDCTFDDIIHDRSLLYCVD